MVTRNIMVNVSSLVLFAGGALAPSLLYGAIAGTAFTGMPLLKTGIQRFRRQPALNSELFDSILLTSCFVAKSYGGAAFLVFAINTGNLALSWTRYRLTGNDRQESRAYQLQTRGENYSDNLALPMALGGGVALPFIGLYRAAGIMNSSPVYTYRVVAPIAMLSTFRTMEAQGIWIRDGRVLELLLKGDTVLIVLDDESIEQLRSCTGIDNACR